MRFIYQIIIFFILLCIIIVPILIGTPLIIEQLLGQDFINYILSCFLIMIVMVSHNLLYWLISHLSFSELLFQERHKLDLRYFLMISTFAIPLLITILSDLIAPFGALCLPFIAGWLSSKFIMKDSTGICF